MDNQIIDRILKRREPGYMISVSYLYALLLANPAHYGVADVRMGPSLREFENACIEHCKTRREDRELFVEV